MNSVTDENLKVVLDTNILISAIAFGGKPEEVLNLVLDEKIIAVTSPILLAEFQEVYNKNFPLKFVDFELTLEKIEEIFKIVKPKRSLKIVRDEDDNRVLEAAAEGSCKFIITGDKDLLDLANYQNIKIVTAEQFLSEFLI
ncbi:putative toxin-antitoxin system toxin component, PIN family [Candidatus Daviesbacteria bacterium]|nr:putative toxin-antitoxin system toxin component, PIN family [Candidatus Daviesbacteria bacterium]